MDGVTSSDQLSLIANNRTVQSEEDHIPMGGTTSMWADVQMPSADLDPGPVQVADAKPAEAKAIIGRSPGQLAWMRLRRDRSAMISLWVLVAFIAIAVLAPLVQLLYGYGPLQQDSGLLGETGLPAGY